MTHLILHKVRGEPAFDVAEQLQCPICTSRGSPCDDFNMEGKFKCDNGVWWIIPTSGHRCYPYATWPLVQLVIGPLPDVPKGHPDHYACNDTSLPEQEFDLGKLLAGLVPKIKRRI